MSYVQGGAIRALREKNHMTQKQLADRLCVSDKAVSKWETGRGLPDISLLEGLAKALGVSMAELFSGEQVVNQNRSANLKRGSFYACPLCGNVLYAAGQGVYSCCGVTLPPLVAEEPEGKHEIHVERVETDYYVTLSHPMEREHFISFMALVTDDRVLLVRLYPQQEAAVRFPISGPGVIYAFCNRHGLFKKDVGRQNM